MDKIPYIVVYKKFKGRKHYLKVLYNNLDDIIDNNKRKPIIPNEFELIEIGWGKPFIKKYMEMYNIKQIEPND